MPDHLAEIDFENVIHALYAADRAHEGIMLSACEVAALVDFLKEPYIWGRYDEDEQEA